ncbi:hypothetical protein MBLNU230_g7813t1 [Neophaeotheca triangularis]
MSNLLRRAIVNRTNAANAAATPNTQEPQSFLQPQQPQQTLQPLQPSTPPSLDKGKKRAHDQTIEEPCLCPECHAEQPPPYEALPRSGTSPIQYYRSTADYSPTHDQQNLARDSLAPSLTLGELQKSNFVHRRKYLSFVQEACETASRTAMESTMRDNLRGLEAFATHVVFFTTWAGKVAELLRKRFKPDTRGEELWRALAEVQELYREQHEVLWQRVEDGEMLTRRQADGLFLSFFCSQIQDHPGLRGVVEQAGEEADEPMVGRLRYFSDTMQRIDRPERMLWTLWKRIGDVDLTPGSRAGKRLPEAKWEVVLEMKRKVAIANELLDVSERCGIRAIRDLRTLAVELRDLDMALEVYQGDFFEIEQGLDLYPVAFDSQGRAIFLQES